MVARKSARRRASFVIARSAVEDARRPNPRRPDGRPPATVDPGACARALAVAALRCVTERKLMRARGRGAFVRRRQIRLDRRIAVRPVDLKPDRARNAVCVLDAPAMCERGHDRQPQRPRVRASAAQAVPGQSRPPRRSPRRASSARSRARSCLRAQARPSARHDGRPQGSSGLGAQCKLGVEPATDRPDWSVERFRTLVSAQPRSPRCVGSRRKLKPDARRALMDAPASGESRNQK